MRSSLWERPILWPIPEEVCYTKTPKLCLNGAWQLTHAPSETFYSMDEDITQWETVEVPRQVFHPTPDEYAFAKDIEIPADWAGQRIVLRFEGANCESRLFCNGRYVRSHYGGFVSWDADITDFCKAGDKARVVLGIYDRPREVCTFHSGGLIRDTYLYTQPGLHLMRVQAETLFEGDYTKAKLVAHTGVSGTEAPAKLAVYLDDVLLGESAAPAPDVDLDLTYQIESPRLWDSEHPNLYTLTVVLYENGVETERASKRIGFREVRRIENKVYVNGQEVKLHGVNRHDIHPITGRGITHELVEQDVKLFKEANVNFIRTSHYPPRPDFLDLCDEYGIYIEDEASVAFLGQSIHFSESDPAYTSRFMGPFTEQMERDQTHPCVIMWSLANESYYGDNLRLMNAYAHEVDPGRITIFSYPITMQDDDQRVDVWSVHYADWDTDPAAMMDQWKRGYSWPTPNQYPVLHDESTHIPCHDPKDLKRDPGIRNFWGETIRRLWDRIWDREGALGCAIWAGIDDVWYREDGKGQMLPWGIFDAWRRKKPEWWHVRKGYSYVKILRETFTSYGQPRVDVENRFNHTNLKEVTFRWKANGKSGSFMGPDAKPHQKATLTFPVELHPGEKLELEVIDSQGYQVNEAVLIHQQEPVRLPYADAGAPKVVEDETSVTFTGDAMKLTISKCTGQILSGQILAGEAGGKTVVTGGPHLHLTGLALAPWTLEDLSWTCQEKQAQITIRGGYGPVKVTFVMALDRKGTLVTDYTITDMPYNSPHNQAFNECGHDVGGYEEVGLWFETPLGMDTLHWQRQGEWSVYPEWHTDRLEGSAGRFDSRKVQCQSEEPQWDWKEDAYEWSSFGPFDPADRGSYDFRSMKDRILSAAMEDAEGAGFKVLSDGTAAVRLENQYADSATYNDDDPSITYTGTWWRINTRNRSYKGEHMTSQEPGAKAEWTFEGTGCIWYTTKDIICGVAKVYVDGEFKAAIDLGSKVHFSVGRGNEAIYHEMAYAVTDLPMGEHRLTIEVTDDMGPNRQGTYVTIDRLVALRDGCQGPAKMIVNQEFNYPDLTWGCYYKEPILVASGYTGRVTAVLTPGECPNRES